MELSPTLENTAQGAVNLTNIMKYHAPTKQFKISQECLELTSMYLLNAIRHIRDANGLDVAGYSHQGMMKNPQFAETYILDAAKKLGIDLGAERYGELDVSKVG